jgi:hypothetical protein
MIKMLLVLNDTNSSVDNSKLPDFSVCHNVNVTNKTVEQNVFYLLGSLGKLRNGLFRLVNAYEPSNAKDTYTTTPQKLPYNNEILSLESIVDNEDLSLNVTSNDNFPPIPTSTNITLSLSSENIIFGESSILTANLTNVSGNPIPNANIIFNINGNNYNNSTNDNGIATYIFTPDHVGEYNITATFNGDEYYNQSTGNAVLNVNLAPTNLVINPVNGTNGNIVDLTVQLKDNNFNTPINNKSINFTVDGKNIGNNNTNNNGVAVYHYKINEVKGNYTITGSFTGDEEYIASEGNNTLMVFNMNFMNVTATNPNGTVNITGSLIDDDGLGVGGVNVNCNNVTANTNPDGSFSIIDNEHHISPGDKTINSVNYNANDTVYVPPTITYNDFGKAYTLKVSYLFADNIILISFNYTFNTTEYAERYGGYYNYIQGRGINSTYDSNTGLIQINFDVPSNRIGEAMIYFYR